MQALCTLDTIGALTPAIVARALKDRHPGVRRQAVRLGDDFAASQPELLAQITRLVDDPDGGVRQQVAYSLGEWKDPAAGVALARLVRQNQDPFILAAAMSSALPHADTMIAQMNAGGGADRTLVEIVIATQNLKALAELLAAIAAPRNPPNPASQFASLGGLLDSLRRNESSLEKLQAKADAPMKLALDRIAGLFDDARAVSGNARAPLAPRLAAVELLGRGIGRQEEVAGAVVFLAAGTTNYVNAEVVLIDGAIATHA